MGKKLLSSPLTGLKDSSAKSEEPLWQEAISYKPRTPLGQKLLRIRERIVPLASGYSVGRRLNTK